MAFAEDRVGTLYIGFQDEGSPSCATGSRPGFSGRTAGFPTTGSGRSIRTPTAASGSVPRGGGSPSGSTAGGPIRMPSAIPSATWWIDLRTVRQVLARHDPGDILGGQGRAARGGQRRGAPPDPGHHAGTGPGVRVAGVGFGTQPGAVRAPDGSMWFSTRTGLVRVMPDDLRMNEVPPPVQIERVAVDGKPVTAGSEIRLPPGARTLVIDYTALTFVDPSRIAFRYELVGHDARWVNAGTRRTAYYNNLSPGTYNSGSSPGTRTARQQRRRLPGSQAGAVVLPDLVVLRLGRPRHSDPWARFLSLEDRCPQAREAPPRGTGGRADPGARPGQGGRRGGEPGQEPVPGQHEPRDPDAHERGDRDGRTAARHPARRGAARIRGDRRAPARPARGHQRHPGLLQDRGRQARASSARIRPEGSGRGRPGALRPRPRTEAAELACWVDDRRCRTRSSANPAGSGRSQQPGGQRGEVHRSGGGLHPGLGPGHPRADPGCASRSATPASVFPGARAALPVFHARRTPRPRGVTAGPGSASTISKRLIEAMGGAIGVESPPGQGIGVLVRDWGRPGGIAGPRRLRRPRGPRRQARPRRRRPRDQPPDPDAAAPPLGGAPGEARDAARLSATRRRRSTGASPSTLAILDFHMPGNGRRGAGRRRSGPIRVGGVAADPAQLLPAPRGERPGRALGFAGVPRSRCAGRAAPGAPEALGSPAWRRRRRPRPSRIRARAARPAS